MTSATQSGYYLLINTRMSVSRLGILLVGFVTVFSSPAYIQYTYTVEINLLATVFCISLLPHISDHLFYSSSFRVRVLLISFSYASVWAETAS